MHKLKSLDNKYKYKKEKIYARRKTYDYKNIINLDKDTSEMNVNIKKYPPIRKKNSFIEYPVKINANNFPILIKKKNCFNFHLSKLTHCNSLTSSTSFREKTIKKVTFSTVEIIRIEKYKKYNAACNYSKAQIQKNIEDLKKDEKESICLIF